MISTDSKGDSSETETGQPVYLLKFDVIKITHCYD